jgi:death-on-curing protein
MQEPIWLSYEDIMLIHEIQLANYGGLEGVRDENLLISAIMRPQNMFAYEQPTIFEMAASLAFGLAKNHPFNDANKRTATVSCISFLRINDANFNAPQEELVITMVALASSQISQTEFAKWLELNCKKV